MIVLDTNVLSELMQTRSNSVVMKWLDTQPPESIWTTSVCVYEILYGINILAKGKRRQSLQEAFEKTLDQDLGGRVLDFDSSAARKTASIAAKLKLKGYPTDFRDVQISGIVAARHGTLATGNTKHFVETGISFTNPWKYEPK